MASVQAPTSVSQKGCRYHLQVQRDPTSVGQTWCRHHLRSQWVLPSVDTISAQKPPQCQTQCRHFPAQVQGDPTSGPDEVHTLPCPGNSQPNWFLTKMQKQFNGGRVSFSTNSPGAIGHPLKKKRNPDLNVTPHTAINSKWIMKQNYLTLGK